MRTFEDGIERCISICAQKSEQWLDEAERQAGKPGFRQIAGKCAAVLEIVAAIRAATKP